MHFDSRTPTFYILVSEFKPLEPELFKNGIKLATVDHSRDAAEIKTTNYVEAVKNINKRQKKEKFFEILYVSNGVVLEASTSNFFAFIGDKFIAPKDNILKGITRNLVIKLAEKEFEVEERELKTEELNLATEAFITATNKDIVPSRPNRRQKNRRRQAGQKHQTADGNIRRVCEELLKPASYHNAWYLFCLSSK